MIKRIVFITFACSLLIAYGVMQRELAAKSDFLPTVFKTSHIAVGVAPIPGSRLVRSHASMADGAKALTAHYVTSYSAEQAVDQFISRAGKKARTNFAGPGCRAAAYEDGSQVIGIVAFDSDSGCNYFLTSAPSPEHRKGSQARDHGEDAPGIPAPPESKRLMSLQDVGGIKSALVFYEGWGGIPDKIDFYREELGRQGWEQQQLAEQLLTKELRGKLLAFRRKTQRCYIYLEHDPRTNFVTTAVLYRNKDWLPADRLVNF